MPVYDYDCTRCGPFTALRPMAESALPLACPDCGAEAPRVILGAPHLALMSSARRTASATNERSAHAPEHSRHTHSATCGCGKGNKAGGLQMVTGQRPWMISH
jgi:putative FmdB family regulatory protein